MKRIICLTLLVVILLLAGCDNSHKTLETEIQKGVITEMFQNNIELFSSGKLKAVIIYPEDASSAVSACATKISDLLKEKYEVFPKILVDKDATDTEGMVEILIGQTNRLESALNKIGKTDMEWFVKCINGKIVINGTTDYMEELATDYFINECINKADSNSLIVDSNLCAGKVFSGYYREGWLLERVPAYRNGTLSETLYDCGTLVSQSHLTVPDTCKMQIVSNTDKDELSEYISLLISSGYSVETHSNIDKNEYYGLFDGTNRLYVYYTCERARVNVIYDNASVTTKSISYTYVPQADERTEFYLYGLKMDQHGIKFGDEGNDGNINCGMLMVVKCADNSLIIIDGGISSQMTEEDIPKFDSFLHTITGKKSNDKVRISAWFFTHYHGDHTMGMLKFLQGTQGIYSLERMIVNFPVVNDGTVFNISCLVSQKYPDCKEIKIHTGQEIQLADCKIKALYTHEDNVDESTGRTLITDSNDTSTVIKITTPDMSMMVLGDMSTSTEKILLKSFEQQTFKSDVVQTAHHNFNYITTLYDYINAPIAFFAQSEGGIVRDEKMTRNSDYVKKFSKTWYCGGNVTAGVAYKDGAVKEIYYERLEY